jgi:hypothetical protein
MPDSEPLTELAFAAESGDANAQYRLGVLFLSGARVEQDVNAAQRWFQAAAANGSGAAEAMREATSEVRMPLPFSARRRPFGVFALPLVALLSLSVHAGYEYSRQIQTSRPTRAQERVFDPMPATSTMTAVPESSLKEPIAQIPSAAGTVPGDLPVARRHYKGRRRK